MHLTKLDRLIGFFFPGIALRRLQERRALAEAEARAQRRGPRREQARGWLDLPDARVRGRQMTDTTRRRRA